MADNEKQGSDSGNSFDDQMVVGIAALVAAIAIPTAAIAAFLTYLMFSWQKIRFGVILTYVVAPLAVIALVLSVPAIGWLTESFTVTLPSIFAAGNENVFGTYLLYAAQQAPFGLLIGSLIGVGYGYFRWKSKPKWEATDFRRTPMEVRRMKKNISDIKANRNSPDNGMTLGIDEDGHRVVQTDEEAEAHTAIMGASGSGKTVTLMTRLRDAIFNGHAAAIIDLKGGPDLSEQAADLARRTGKRFIHFTLIPDGEVYDGPAVDGPAYYDPLVRGDATRRRDLLMGAHKWPNAYFEKESSNYLQLAMSALIAVPPAKPMSTFADLVTLLRPERLIERIIPIASDPEYVNLVTAVNAMGDQAISKGKQEATATLRTQMEDLLNSTAGKYLKLDPDTTRNNNINLKDVAHNGDIVLFSIDSSNYPQLAKLISNLIIEDLKTVSSELRRDPAPRPMQVLIDEFASIESDNIIGLINKSRDAKMPVTLATQALGDLKKMSDAFMEQFLGIVASFIIHRANIHADALLYAGLTGESSKEVYNRGFSDGDFSGSGMVTEQKTFTIPPSTFQNLKKGEMVYVNRSLSPMKILKVNVIKEDLDEKPSMSRSSKASVERQNSKVQDIPAVRADAPVAAPASSPAGDAAPASQTHFSDQDLTPTLGEYEANNVKKHEPDMDRLKGLFTQDPNALLRQPAVPKLPERHLPPHVSKPMSQKHAPLPPASGLPPFPGLGKTPPKKPIVQNDETKDLFDF